VEYSFGCHFCNFARILNRGPNSALNWALPSDTSIYAPFYELLWSRHHQGNQIKLPSVPFALPTQGKKKLSAAVGFQDPSNRHVWRPSSMWILFPCT
jgi:hypothetical protein